MTHPTITKEQAVQLAIDTGLLSDGFCVSDSDAATIHTFAQAAYKLGRNAGLEEAKQTAAAYGPSIPSLSVRGRWEGEQAASIGIALAIESLKDHS